jgi:putative transposase
VVDTSWAHRWHNENRVDFSRSGKPTDNAFIDILNGTLCDECLKIHWFESVVEAKRLSSVFGDKYDRCVDSRKSIQAW